MPINFSFWKGNNEPLVNAPLYQSGNLEVIVDEAPIGGFRGKVGTLSINHKDRKVFTNWDKDELQTLAEITQKVLKIQEDAGVTNTLIFAKQHKEDFKFSMVVYPKCNLLEKIRGAIDVYFTPSKLNQKQIDEIKNFYTPLLAKDIPIPPPEAPVDKEDPFCKAAVIEKQRVVHLDFKGETDYSYDVLHDNHPKGPSKEDSHLLVIPEGKSGHRDGSQVPVEQRFQMLQTIQKAVKYFLEEGFPTVAFLERNGSKLQGVQHKHGHMMGVKQFPESFFSRLLALIRLAWSSMLSDDQLKSRQERYQKVDWTQLTQAADAPAAPDVH